MHGFGKELHVCWFGLVWFAGGAACSLMISCGFFGSSVWRLASWYSFLHVATGDWRLATGDWRLAGDCGRYEAKVEINAINLQSTCNLAAICKWGQDRGKSGPISDPV